MSRHQGEAGDCRAEEKNPFRSLPSVEQLLGEPEFQSVSSAAGAYKRDIVRHCLAEMRSEIKRGWSPSPAQVRERVLSALAELSAERLVPVINGTGVIVHTNLGRAPVSRATADAMVAAASGNVAVEIDLVSGRRGGRMSEISTLMRILTGAESTLVVNNNAAAVLVVLSCMATRREVVVSRGEAVEIGGGFRIPDVLRQSGATVVEVGTTNRTYVHDYASAITEHTACLLKVHPSNFAITGFARSTSVNELADLGRQRSIPVVEDLGSGALIDSSRFGIAAEPTIGDSIAAGASVVTASGDKLLGGPQAGIIAGSQEWVDRIAAHPLARAVRADKVTLAGIAATLRHYVRGEAEREIPVWQMIATPIEALNARAESLIAALTSGGLTVSQAATESTIGGGALPGQTLPSVGVSIDQASEIGIETCARRLRTGQPGVIPHVVEGKLVVDLRTVRPEDDRLLASAITSAVAS